MFKYKILLLLSYTCFSLFVSGQIINIHSISTIRNMDFDNGYTLDGERMISSVFKLKNPQYFSDTGVYKKSVNLYNGYYTPGSLEEITQSNDIDIFFFGSFVNMSDSSSFTKSEIDSIYKWSMNGGKMIIAEQRGIVHLSNKWDYTIINSSSYSYPSVVGESTLLFNGPFGKVNRVKQGGGGTGYIRTTSTHFVALAKDILGNSTIVFDCNSKDLIFADTDFFTDLGGISQGNKIVNEQDIFWANTIAFMDSYNNLSNPVLQYDGTYLKTDEYISYQWLFNGEPVSGSIEQKFKPTTEGYYSVVVETNLGCMDTSEVFSYPFENLNIPNIISPNDDGLNDYLFIDRLPHRSEFVVFNRASIIVFRSDDYQNNWDGTDQQKQPLKNDTYWYVLKTPDGKKYSGYIVINK